MKKLILSGIVLLTIVFISTFSQAATSWYFPEGSTQGFDLWIPVTNTNSTDASITYTFYTDTSTETSTATVTANSRSTLWVNTISGLDDKPISTKVECTNSLNIYAERAQYWPKKYGTSVTEWEGGHTARGVSGEEGDFSDTVQLAVVNSYESDAYAVTQPSSFPVSIDTAGSYYVAEDITCTDATVDAVIEISASNVTLDLRGHTITGPGQAASGATFGISLAGTATTILYNVKVINGVVTENSRSGINVNYSNFITIKDINSYKNGATGIAVIQSASTRIESCQAIDNTTNGMYFLVSNYSYVEDNIITDNDSYGLSTVSANDSLFKGNLICNNTKGIYIGGLSTNNSIIENHCTSNTSEDLNFDGTNNLCINNAVDSAVTEGGADENEIGSADVTANDNPVL